MTLDINVLGTIRVCVSGVDHPVAGAKQRALLACLAQSRGRPLPPDQLIVDLWGSDPPRNPAHALQARISRLRSILPVDLELRDGGYRLDPATTRIDSALFESLCENGSRLLAEGDLASASDHLRQALRLWRGTPFSGVPPVDTLHRESVRLESVYASALADRIDLDLALGDAASVISELRALIETQPFLERSWAQLMTALHSAGRTQEALGAFARVRSLFIDELGVEPTDALADLHVAILQGRARSPRAAARPSISAPIAGSAAPARRSPQLPTAAVSSSRGDALQLLLQTHNALVLTGPAGIGKTHLLRAVESTLDARDNSPPFLSASALSRDVPLGVFSALSDLTTESRSSPAALIDAFARHRSTTVLLIDNVDNLDDASLFVITQLIRTSRVPAILTCRTLTDAPCEIQALYDGGDLVEIPVHELSGAEARDVIVGILGAQVTPDTAPRLIAAAEGNPLHLREIISGSVSSGCLVETDHGWELREPPTATARLAQLVDESFGTLADDLVSTAALVAIAGELPASALDDGDRRSLTRVGVLSVPTRGWVRLTHPLAAAALRTRLSAPHWHDLTDNAVDILLGSTTQERPDARRRGLILALDIDHPIEIEDAIALGSHALGAFDERLALRAAEYAISRDPMHAQAFRLAGLAASSLGLNQQADEHFRSAREAAQTGTEKSDVALAHAQHLGVRLYDASAALIVLGDTLASLHDSDDRSHLERAMTRWATVSGLRADAARAPDTVPDSAAALGLITVAMSCVITGPLRDADVAIAQLNDVPQEHLDLVPGGSGLVDLIKIMALSHTGDVVAARHALELRIAESDARSPETLGIWEYALGFTELLAGDAERADTLARRAVTHLAWRDIAGLLPTAHALAGAAAECVGRYDDSSRSFDAVPEPALGDPKVVMLRAWRDAQRLNVDGDHDGAARLLLDTARWLLDAQHTYFAGMLAHCVVRIGIHRQTAVQILDEARLRASGGLLDLFARHGHAARDQDALALAAIANDARELGLVSTAVDTWFELPDASATLPDHGAALARWSPPRVRV